MATQHPGIEVIETLHFDLTTIKTKKPAQGHATESPMVGWDFVNLRELPEEIIGIGTNNLTSASDTLVLSQSGSEGKPGQL